MEASPGLLNLVTISGVQHHDTLLDSLWKFVHDQEKVDFGLARSGGLLWAHQLILRVFFPPERLQHIAPQHWHDSSMDWLLEFVYRGTVAVPQQHLDSFLELARQLDFAMLVDAVLAAGSCGPPTETPSTRGPGDGITDARSSNYELAPYLNDQTMQSATLDKTKLTEANAQLDRMQTSLSIEAGRAQITFKQETDCWEQSTGNDNDESQREWTEPTIKLEVHSPQIVYDDESDDSSTEVGVGRHESDFEDLQETTSSQSEMNSYSQMESINVADYRTNVSVIANAMTSAASIKTSSEIAKKLSAGLQCPVALCQKSNTPYNPESNYFPDFECAKPKICAINPADTSPMYEIVSTEVADNLSGVSQDQQFRGSSQTRQFECKVCCKAFSNTSILRRHYRTHTGEKPYKCQVCSKAFNQSCHLVGHMRVHTGEKPYKCQVCSKAFSQNSLLVQHSRIHTGEKPYQCQACSKAFCHSSDLVRHRRTHTDERPYACNVCFKSFNRSHILAKHLLIHTGC